jgi:hypothetical protein
MPDNPISRRQPDCLTAYSRRAALPRQSDYGRLPSDSCPNASGKFMSHADIACPEARSRSLGRVVRLSDDFIKVGRVHLHRTNHEPEHLLAVDGHVQCNVSQDGRLQEESLLVKLAPPENILAPSPIPACRIFVTRDNCRCEISGPRFVDGSSPWPSFRELAYSATPAATRSYTFSCEPQGRRRVWRRSSGR